ncbi:MAG TPA: Gfo/Idh/MocA family oxidoreductase [Bryobacteraceae bacterium]|jgi:hypothetical protein
MKNKILLPIAFLTTLAVGVSGADLRLGVIGTDTSHSVVFAHALNDAANPNHVAGGRIVVAYKGGSPDVEESRSRVEKFSTELQGKLGVRFVDHISEMCSAVDGILLESLDGRKHLPEMKEAVKCGKPIFIDKPLAASLSDAREIARVAGDAHVPWFSASSLRFSDIESMKQEPINGVIVWGPGPTERHQELDLSWYGVHAVEMLYTLMGPGCSEVTLTHAENADVVTGKWKDGRLGTIRVERPYTTFGAVAFRSKNKVDTLANVKVDYLPLVRKIIEFMQTQKPPVSNAETLEIFAFMDAAQKSKEHGGSPVSM